ncbi:MAG: hypothetical protein ACJ79R_21640 [Anaeromyxobacteraceae bacterium]
MTDAAHRESKLLRLYLGVFSLFAVTMLLAASWLRFFVPHRAARARLRVRDVSWLHHPGR